MASFNKVLLMGRLTRDPELRYTPSNTPVADFGFATRKNVENLTAYRGTKMYMAPEILKFSSATASLTMDTKLTFFLLASFSLSL